ncbi:MAG: hypothetical protein LC102_05325 [Ignavibacteriales bacterium]|jgi:hypothetical protein|nr:MAG: hypothetical protein F9K26_06780 [Ignavibacteriaceae bacterium]MBW7873187.1 hypothetical protein [Ignavibacteria bacterium]MCZ2142829.1 hypothetical protein [Ignavibacteriales bacterium]OQY75217.1 MAG: hypothetical protein B6D45_05925 [Ignavibacteriales bacterium UTCHB3]MBV6443923.1 hypothetical protein [Ignavibacteriaceae bacterium]
MSYSEKHTVTANAIIEFEWRELKLYAKFKGQRDYKAVEIENLTDENKKIANLELEIPVEINIEVDTEQFDKKIDTTVNQVNTLNDSIIGTAEAEEISIIENADRIATTVVSGFFSYIKSDISQQIAELQSSVDAKFVEMMKQKENALSKVEQMREDFQRITSRYTKIFSELDKELSNRIYALEADSLKLKKLLTEIVEYQKLNKSLATSTVTNREEALTQSKLYASKLKVDTYNFVTRAQGILASYKILGRSLDSILQSVQIDEPKQLLLPVIFREAQMNAEVSVMNSYVSAETPKSNATADFKATLEQHFTKAPPLLAPVSQIQRQQIERFFNEEIERSMEKQDEHSKRVLDKIFSLWENNNDFLTNLS